MPSTLRSSHRACFARRPALLRRHHMKQLALLAVFFISCVSARAENWPQSRGPQASGLDRDKALPTKWDLERKENVGWRTAVPGLSHAAPIVWGDRVYATTAVGPGASELM